MRKNSDSEENQSRGFRRVYMFRASRAQEKLVFETLSLSLCVMHVSVDGWMNGRMDRWLDGWMSGWMNSWMVGWMV
jgi:hypothetical protein